MSAILALLATGLRLAMPILIAALGETFAESAGVLNIGLEGMLTLGAFAGYVVAEHTHSVAAALLAAIPTGLLGAELLGWFVIRARASQLVVGVLFNALATGVAAYLYRLDCPPGVTLATLTLPKTDALGLTLPFYALLLLVPLAEIALRRSRFGLNLRAAGEAPQAAATAGLDVERLRMWGLRLSCLAGALGGAYLVVCQIGLFRESVVAGQGFAALAMVIFGRWRPIAVAACAVLFGCLDALQFIIQLDAARMPPQLFLALPYLVSALAISGLFGRARQPAALGVPWRREQRD